MKTLEIIGNIFGLILIGRVLSCLPSPTIGVSLAGSFRCLSSSSERAMQSLALSPKNNGPRLLGTIDNSYIYL